MHLAGFQRGADNAVQTCILGGLGVVHHHLVNGGVNHQIPLHGLLVGGGQLGDGNQQGAAAVGAGQTLQGGGHHGGGTGGVEVADVHIQVAQNCHGLFHRVGNVVELQIQENLVAPGLNLPDNGGAFGVVQLHTNFYKGLLPFKFVQKRENLLCAGKVAGNNNILTHCVRLL